MKKSNLILSLALGALIFSSCGKKEMDITMNMVDKGNLNIAVQNDAGTGIADLEVKLYDAYTDYEIESKATNASGNVDFSPLLSGPYYVYIPKVNVNDVNYQVYQPVQVINNENKSYTIKPTEYSGSVIISVRDNNTTIPIEGINVGVFRYDDYNSLFSNEFSAFDGIVLKRGVTDANGKTTITGLPLDEYGIFVYVDDTDWNYDNYSFYINEKGEEVKATFWF
jgi:hypothetical protein